MRLPRGHLRHPAFGSSSDWPRHHHPALAGLHHAPALRGHGPRHVGQPAPGRGQARSPSCTGHLSVESHRTRTDKAGVRRLPGPCHCCQWRSWREEGPFSCLSTLPPALRLWEGPGEAGCSGGRRTPETAVLFWAPPGADISGPRRLLGGRALSGPCGICPHGDDLPSYASSISDPGPQGGGPGKGDRCGARPEDKQPPPLEELTNMPRVVTLFVGILGRRNSRFANILC